MHGLLKNKRGKQKGVFLVITLIIITIVFILSVMFTIIMTVSGKTLQKDQQTVLALYVADSGIKYAYNYIAFCDTLNSLNVLELNSPVDLQVGKDYVGRFTIKIADYYPGGVPPNMVMPEPNDPESGLDLEYNKYYKIQSTGFIYRKGDLTNVVSTQRIRGVIWVFTGDETGEPIRKTKLVQWFICYNDTGEDVYPPSFLIENRYSGAIFDYSR